jgi:hypothetical protein
MKWYFSDPNAPGDVELSRSELMSGKYGLDVNQMVLVLRDDDGHEVAVIMRRGDNHYHCNRISSHLSVASAIYEAERDRS